MIIYFYSFSILILVFLLSGGGKLNYLTPYISIFRTHPAYTLVFVLSVGGKLNYLTIYFYI